MLYLVRFNIWGRKSRVLGIKRNESVMKWKEKERKWNDFPDILHFSPIFSIFLRNSPIFSRNDRKNDRKRPETTAKMGQLARV